MSTQDPNEMERRLDDLEETIEDARREIERHQRDIGPRESHTLMGDDPEEDGRDGAP